MPFGDDCHDAAPPPASPTVDAFPRFADRVRARLDAGRAYEAARPAVDRPALELLTEIQEELEDVAGWACALWTRLEGIRGKAAHVDQDEANRERGTRGSW